MKTVSIISLYLQVLYISIPSLYKNKQQPFQPIRIPFCLIFSTVLA